MKHTKNAEVRKHFRVFGVFRNGTGRIQKVLIGSLCTL